MGGRGSRGIRNSSNPISIENGTISVAENLQNKIFSITGTDRSDLLNKVAEVIGGNLGQHQVYSGSSKNLTIGDFVIDLSTKKTGQTQTIKNFSVWKSGDRKTIRTFFKG